MRGSIQVLFLLTLRQSVGTQETSVLSELPFAELLARKKIAEAGVPGEVLPVASALSGPPPTDDVRMKGLHRVPGRKTFYEDDYEEDKGHVNKKKKEDHKIHDILNTSIMVLSYLAFGGYLLCMIASALREKKQKVMMTYTSGNPGMNMQLAQVLQHHMTHRPARPYIRFPTVTVHQGRKKRRRRSTLNAQGGSSLFDVIDYIEAFSRVGN